jgi:hypothetical protein
MVETSGIELTSCWPFDDSYGIACCTQDVYIIDKASSPARCFVYSAFGSQVPRSSVTLMPSYSSRALYM